MIYRAPVRGAFTERFGSPLCSFHRADLLSVLAAPCPTEWSVSARAVSRSIRARPPQSPASPTAARSRPTSWSAPTASIRWCAGNCSGPISPRFTGCMCWRGLMPAERIPKGLIEPASSNWMGPNGHVVHYYVRRGEIVNFVAIHDTDQWTQELWICEASRDELMATYARWNPRLLRLFESSERYSNGGCRPRAVGELDQGAGHAAWRLGARHAAVPGARRCDGDRGRLRPRRIGRALLRRSRPGVAALRGDAVPRTRRAVLGSRSAPSSTICRRAGPASSAMSNTPPAGCSMPTARRTASPGYTATMSRPRNNTGEFRNGCCNRQRREPALFGLAARRKQPADSYQARCRQHPARSLWRSRTRHRRRGISSAPSDRPRPRKCRRALPVRSVA